MLSGFQLGGQITKLSEINSVGCCCGENVIVLGYTRWLALFREDEQVTLSCRCRSSWESIANTICHVVGTVLK